jgi:hypothetical protein
MTNRKTERLEYEKTYIYKNIWFSWENKILKLGIILGDGGGGGNHHEVDLHEIEI